MSYRVVVNGAPMVRNVTSQSNAAEIAAAYLTICETDTPVVIEAERMSNDRADVTSGSGYSRYDQPEVDPDDQPNTYAEALTRINS